MSKRLHERPYRCLGGQYFILLLDIVDDQVAKDNL